MKNMGESGESFNSQLFPGPRSFRRMSLCTVVLNATQGGERMWFGSDCSELVIPRAVSLMDSCAIWILGRNARESGMGGGPAPRTEITATVWRSECGGALQQRE